MSYYFLLLPAVPAISGKFVLFAAVFLGLKCVLKIVSKSIKIYPKFTQNQSKINPKFTQNQSKIDPKTIPTNTLFWIAFFIALGSIFGGFGGGPRGVLGSIFGLLGPSWGQDGPQTPPRSPRDRF